MKSKGNILIFGAFLIFISFACKNSIESKTDIISVMVVTGGHSFDTLEFIEMFESIPGITFDTVFQPRANSMIASGEAENYDLFVLYDMWQEADSNVLDGYLNLLEKGKGMVILHHSLVSYQSWDEFKNIIGGKYYEKWSGAEEGKMSTYKHDIDIDVKVSSEQHPVTKSIHNFTIHDEGYGNIEVNPDVKVLLTTDHPDCAQLVGWENSYWNSKIVYLMLGHDKQAYANSNYRRLLGNAINYVNQD
jgi:type 1 glutamine amidotransferase